MSHYSLNRAGTRDAYCWKLMQRCGITATKNNCIVPLRRLINAKIKRTEVTFKRHKGHNKCICIKKCLVWHRRLAQEGCRTLNWDSNPDSVVPCYQYFGDYPEKTGVSQRVLRTRLAVAHKPQNWQNKTDTGNSVKNLPTAYRKFPISLSQSETSESKCLLW